MRREDESVSADTVGYTSIPAICFPGGCALAASWDEELMERLGGLLAEECRAESLPILLGPAINIKRMPVCGRNFEYLSEDPYLAGKLAAAYIRRGTGRRHRNRGQALRGQQSGKAPHVGQRGCGRTNTA